MLPPDSHLGHVLQPAVAAVLQLQAQSHVDGITERDRILREQVPDLKCPAGRNQLEAVQIVNEVIVCDAVTAAPHHLLTGSR
jgi:hypothetical protein